MPQYIAASKDMAIECEGKKVERYNAREEGLSKWSSSVKRVLLVQGSSAAAERVFSLLSASFSGEQDYAFSDSLQATLMLQYNNNHM